MTIPRIIDLVDTYPLFAALAALDFTGDAYFLELIDFSKPVDLYIVAKVIEVLIDSVPPGRFAIPADCPSEE